jgi:hypothetical protein
MCTVNHMPSCTPVWALTSTYRSTFNVWQNLNFGNTGDSLYNETRHHKFDAITNAPTETDLAPSKHFISMQRISRWSDFFLGVLALRYNESHLYPACLKLPSIRVNTCHSLEHCLCEAPQHNNTMSAGLCQPRAAHQGLILPRACDGEAASSASFAAGSRQRNLPPTAVTHSPANRPYTMVAVLM